MEKVNYINITLLFYILKKLMIHKILYISLESNIEIKRMESLSLGSHFIIFFPLNFQRGIISS